MKKMTGTTSKSMLAALVAASLMMASAARARAEDKTVTGDGMCIQGHQTAIKVQEGDKAVTYYLVENDVSKGFHGKICAKAAKVKASGDVKEANGRWELTATKIEFVRQY